MTRTCSFVGAVFAGVTILLASGAVLAQKSKPDSGKKDYVANCAVCHGPNGKGDGPFNEIHKSPANLTKLTKSNKGVFPSQRVYAIIDGREQIEAHGTRDMPIWGAGFLENAKADHSHAGKDSETAVRTRITALVNYVKRLQAK